MSCHLDLEVHPLVGCQTAPDLRYRSALRSPEEAKDLGRHWTGGTMCPCISDCPGHSLAVGNPSQPWETFSRSLVCLQTTRWSTCRFRSDLAFHLSRKISRTPLCSCATRSQDDYIPNVACRSLQRGRRSP